MKKNASLDDIDNEYGWKFICVLAVFSLVFIGLTSIMPDELRPKTEFEKHLANTDPFLYMNVKHQQMINEMLEQN